MGITVYSLYIGKMELVSFQWKLVLLLVLVIIINFAVVLC